MPNTKEWLPAGQNLPKEEFRYFGSNGVMAKGLTKVGSATYYFDPSTGNRSGRLGNDRVEINITLTQSSFKMVTGHQVD